MDTDGSGCFEDDEIKVFLGKMNNLPADAISNSHPELIKFSGLSISQLNEELYRTSSKQVIDAYYDVLFTDAGKNQEDDSNKAPIGMVKQLVDHLDTDRNGSLSREEIKKLFQNLSGVPIDEIDDQHPEVVSFSGLTTGELTHKLWASSSRETIEKFHAACGLIYVPENSILNPRADREIVKQVVKAIDQDGDGSLGVEEIQRLFATLTGQPIESISASAPEVLSYAGLTTDALVEKLWQEVPKLAIEFYHHTLCGKRSAVSVKGQTAVTYNELEAKARQAVVEALASDISCSLSDVLTEVTVRKIFSKVLSVSEDKFDIDYPELSAFVGLPFGRALELVVDAVPERAISGYHDVVLTKKPIRPAAFQSVGEANQTKHEGALESATHEYETNRRRVEDMIARGTLTGPAKEHEMEALRHQQAALKARQMHLKARAAALP